MEEKMSLQEFATESLSEEDESLAKAMFGSGLHWGRRRSLTHPKMKPYIFSSRGDLDVIDLTKSLAFLKKAKEFIKETVSKNNSFLLIGTQPAAREEVARVSRGLGFPFVANRWLGGTLTNFKTLQLRITRLKEIEEKMASPEFTNYTKRERIKFEQEAKEIREKFEGLIAMTELPAALFVLGIKRHELPCKEARRKGIKIIALANTNDDPIMADYPIPGNDNSLPSIKFILEEFEKTVLEARQNAAKEKKELLEDVATQQSTSP
jgi:small subunit ribosomal protein S2